MFSQPKSKNQIKGFFLIDFKLAKCGILKLSCFSFLFNLISNKLPVVVIPPLVILHYSSKQILTVEIDFFFLNHVHKLFNKS